MLDEYRSNQWDFPTGKRKIVRSLFLVSDQKAIYYISRIRNAHIYTTFQSQFSTTEAFFSIYARVSSQLSLFTKLKVSHYATDPIFNPKKFFWKKNEIEPHWRGKTWGSPCSSFHQCKQKTTESCKGKFTVEYTCNRKGKGKQFSNCKLSSGRSLSFLQKQQKVDWVFPFPSDNCTNIFSILDFTTGCTRHTQRKSGMLYILLPIRHCIFSAPTKHVNLILACCVWKCWNGYTLLFMLYSFQFSCYYSASRGSAGINREKQMHFTEL